MIVLNIKPIEVFDNLTGEFVTLPGGTFRFENSLKAISKWETKYMKPFLKNDEQKTQAENLYFFKCMCLDDGFKYEYITNDVVDILSNYMETTHSATTFGKSSPGKPKRSTQILTSELIYAYMTIANIPYECDLWEIHRLMNLINCVSILQNPDKKKRNSKDVAKEYSKLNAQRRAALHTKG